MYYLARQHIETGELGIIQEKLADVKISALLQNIAGPNLVGIHHYMSLLNYNLVVCFVIIQTS